ncbi:hypothetical protein [Nocardia neocaledoniensis]|uniref:hypothetical protein n=1 Tax=Nocardia neocaledoniensis TaxID=236511 RepID=UPI002453982F|nr:hypothetical protein [Nocardia neocaledoniensis]
MFDWYVGLLAFSGIAMLVMADIGNGQGEFARYLIFFQAFILPVLLAVNFVRSTDWTALTTRPTPTQQAWRAYQRGQQRH